MSNFHGICTYPHGSQSSGFLLLAMVCALICTCYSVASCRFVMLEFKSEYGDFEDHFSYDRLPSGTIATFRTGAGLFHFLRPFDESDWTQGACAGYTELQREALDDSYFEAVRLMGIFAVLIGTSIFLYTTVISCLALKDWQRYMLAFCVFCVVLLQGGTFLIYKAALCHEVGNSSNCSFDQGGLVGIAAVAFWTLSALIVVFFVNPVKRSKITAREIVLAKAAKKRQMEKQRKIQEKELAQIRIAEARELNRLRAEQKREIAKQKAQEESIRRAQQREVGVRNQIRNKENKAAVKAQERELGKVNRGRKSKDDASVMGMTVASGTSFDYDDRRRPDPPAAMVSRAIIQEGDESIEVNSTAPIKKSSWRQNKRNYEKEEAELDQIAGGAWMGSVTGRALLRSVSSQSSRDTNDRYAAGSEYKVDPRVILAMEEEIAKYVEDEDEDEGFEVYIGDRLDKLNGLIDDDDDIEQGSSLAEI